MWASSVKEKARRSNSTNSSSVTSSSPTTSSSLANPSPFSQQFLVPNPKPLEDVWKDIRLSSLNVNVNVNHHSSSSSTSNHDINLNATTFSSPVIFQDFFVKESLVKAGSSTRCVPPAPSPAAPFLSLTPGAPGFSNSLFGNSSSSSSDHHLKEKQPSLVQSKSLSDTGFSGSSGGGGVKRDMDPTTNDSLDDHRHKRMIKNRESACRSRARKQAYTNELELVVSNLKKENASLKAQLNQFHNDAVAQQYSSKQQLKRTFTAPF